MKKILFMLAWLLFAACAFPQAADSGDDLARARDSALERAAIEGERSREEARYAREEVACYARFAVTDCLKRARAQRREILDRLRRRELALNEAERKHNAVQQIERIRQKAAPLPPSP